MVDRALSPLPEQKESLRKEKSYREADTQMRAYIDAQQTAVSNKVDEVIASFKEAPLRKRTEKPQLATETVRIEVTPQPQKRSKLILLASAGVVLLGIAGGSYYLLGNQPTPRAAVPPPAISANSSAAETPIAQEMPIPAAPIDDATTAAQQQHAAPPVQEAAPPVAPKEKPSLQPKPKKPAKQTKKPAHYTEQL